ncbi:MAG: hypothetical protein II308_04315 [Muribaculaceae bacterium]|nr:hypothetical protein [Muribaculaceae bacterium]
MKKITFAMLSKLMMLTLMVCSAFSVSAQDVDLGAMTLNTVYDCPVFKSVKGSFTPETDGVYKINYSSSDRFGIFTDAEMTIPYENGGDWAYYSETVEGMKSMGYETWNFVGGTTYYLGGGFGEGLFIMNSNAQLVITTSSSEISLNSVTPAEGSTISTGGTAQIDVAFNCSVLVESATISAGGQTETLIHSETDASQVRTYGNTVSILLKDLLQSWYDSGVISGGEALTVTLNGIRNMSATDVVYGENGSLTLNYIVGEQPAVLVSSINTPDQMSSLKSFYFDDDAAGTISLTFSRRLLNDANDMPFATWGIGNKESETGDYYEERLPITVDGNSVIISLQGKLRDLAAMGLSAQYTDVQIDIKNVKTADGDYVYTEGSGSLGSFNYLYKMEYIVCDIVAEFAPSKGTIKAGDNLEIWIMGESNLRYDGVAFTYGENTTIVKDFEKIQDPDDSKASILNVTVPKLVDAQGNEIATETSVQVTLSNVKAADGYDHSTDVKATYAYEAGKADDNVKGLPVSISPASGSTVKELQTIIFEFSPADYPNTMDYDSSKNPVLYNEAGEAVAEGHMGFADATTYMSLYVTFEAPITEAGVYTLDVPAGAMREYGWGVANPMQCPAMTLTYTIGNAEPQYTINVTPAPSDNVALESISEFTVTFEGVQKIDFSTEAWYAYVQLLDASGNPIQDFGAECEKISEVAYKATLMDTPTELGTYRLTIPENAIIVLDNAGVSGPNKEATFDYNVTYVSVEDIIAEATSFDVYTLNGVCVLRNASAEDVKLLDKGVYIINGRKVALR